MNNPPEKSKTSDKKDIKRPVGRPVGWRGNVDMISVNRECGQQTNLGDR